MPSSTALDLDRAVTLFHALSDPTRLAILELLRGGERCVCDLQDELDAAQSRLSFHLRVLKDAGLVTDRREGRWSYYTHRARGAGRGARPRRRDAAEEGRRCRVLRSAAPAAADRFSRR